MADHKEALQTAFATTHGDNVLPSIFEVLAQENLNSSVRPAAEYLCKVSGFISNFILFANNCLYFIFPQKCIIYLYKHRFV